MNLFDLATVIATVICAYYGGKYLALGYGTPGWILGSLVGGCLPILARYLMGFFLHKCFPAQPPCRNDACHRRHYALVKHAQEDCSFVFRCKCGMKYVQSLPYFMELLEDGTRRPYMIKIKGKWKLDKGGHTEE